MNEKQQINIAIAEAVGLDVENDNPALRDIHCVRVTGRTIPELIPNYTGSLDACAEFERTLARGEGYNVHGRGAYVRLLQQMTGDIEPVDAAPMERCLAFCRLCKIGPFKE